MVTLEDAFTARAFDISTKDLPVMKYNFGLMMAVLHDRIQIVKAVNVTVITLDQVPQSYAAFDQGAAKKFVIDPHSLLAPAA
jgi:glutathione-independent formaldehyde dehydrogenase